MLEEDVKHYLIDDDNLGIGPDEEITPERARQTFMECAQAVQEIEDDYSKLGRPSQELMNKKYGTFKLDF